MKRNCLISVWIPLSSKKILVCRNNDQVVDRIWKTISKVGREQMGKIRKQNCNFSRNKTWFDIKTFPNEKRYTKNPFVKLTWNMFEEYPIDHAMSTLNCFAALIMWEQKQKNIVSNEWTNMCKRENRPLRYGKVRKQPNK